MIRYIAGSALYSLILTAVIIVVSGYQLDPSGTYCFIPYSSIPGFSILYVAGIIGPISFLVYNVILTYLNITEAQRLLEELGIHEQAKGRYIHMAKKLGMFFFTTMTCYFPGIIAAFYEWTTGQYFPVPGSIVAGVSAYVLSSLLNPSLFFYLNVDLREKFWEKFGAPIYRLLGLKSLKPKTFSHTKLASRISSCAYHFLKPSASIHCESNATVSTGNKSMVSMGNRPEDEFIHWLSHDALAKIIKEHARKEYVMENFLFYEDAIAYRTKATAFVNTIKKIAAESIESSIQRVYASEDLQRDWRELETMANRIYCLYIEVRSYVFRFTAESMNFL